MMKLAGIFRDLEQLYDFQIIGYGGHFIFQKFCRQVFIAINIPCKFGEDIFINEWDIKVYAKMWRMDGWMHVRKAFYNLPTMAFGRRWEIKTASSNKIPWALMPSKLWCLLIFVYKDFKYMIFVIWRHFRPGSKTFPFKGCGVITGLISYLKVMKL